MGVVVPNNHHLFVATMICDGSTHNVQFTCGGLNQVTWTATDALAAWDSSVRGGASGKLFSAGEMFVSYQLVKTEVWLRSGSGILTVAQNLSGVTGTKTGSGTPMNTSLKVKKVTGIAGKKFRGYMFMPPAWIDETNVTPAGTISLLTTFQTLLTNMFNSLASNSVTPKLFHSDLSTPTTVTAFQLQGRVGSIPRRFRN